MPRTKEANEFLKKQRQNNILITALRLFCLKGYDNVTMDQIAKEAKVSHGLVYHYFTNKTEILGKLIEQGKKRIEEVLIDKPKIDRKGAEFYKNFTDFILECVKKGEEYVYYINLFFTFKFSINDYQEYSNLAFYKKFENEFIYAQNQGVFEEGSPRDFLTCYFSLLQSIVHAIMVSKKKPCLPPSSVIMNVLYKKKEVINETSNQNN